MKSSKTYFNWSTGKDSALALYKLQRSKTVDIDLLLCSVNSHFNRVSMHGLRRELLVAQAKSIGIPLETIELPESPSMEEYGNIMLAKVSDLINRGFNQAVFGDIFLEDLKKYRDEQLRPLGIKTLYPLWKQDTSNLIQEFIDYGFKSVIVSASGKYFDEGFVGQTITKDLINSLPDSVDPCGENGEFHTFCYDGPNFTIPIDFQIGEKIRKEYQNPKTDDTCGDSSGDDTISYWYCDLKLK